MTREANKGECRRETLAEGKVAVVERCSCGALQLVMGPMTLRFDPDALGDLHGTICAALAQLGASDASSDRLPVAAFARAPRGQA